MRGNGENMKISQTFFKVFLCTIVFSCVLVSQAITAEAVPPPTRENVNVHLSSDVTIQFGDYEKSFFDANGANVFPIIFQGTTYLPVRAISALMGENIEWDGVSRTIFIGRTLSNPAASPPGSVGNYARVGSVPYFLRPPAQIVDAIVLRDIIIMYDFEVQRFYDANGRVVYPINFQGSNYLPVRAIAGLMGEEIDWDAEQRRITITRGIAEILDEELQARILAFEEFLTATAAVFDRTTARILGLPNAIFENETWDLVILASEDVRNADTIVENLRNINIEGFSETEIAAHYALWAYAVATAQYALISENIKYMAFREQDFSIFAETFLALAADAQAKFEIARNAIRELQAVSVSPQPNDYDEVE